MPAPSVRHARGASALTYGLVVGLVAVGAVAATTRIGESVESLFGQVDVAFVSIDTRDGDRDQDVQQVTVRFDGLINGASFPDDCSPVSGVGSDSSTVTPVDFSFYIHDVSLSGPDGPVTVDLASDGAYQDGRVALLDLSACDGSPTNFTVKGTVPSGTYSGLSFVLGVPEDLNHQDTNAAAAPLSYPPLQWNWRDGWKFARLDFSDANGSFFVHLGSTGTGAGGFGCGTGPGNAAPAQPCTNANRYSITLPGFDPTTDVVTADIGALVAQEPIGSVVGGAGRSQRGCMSSPGDPECDTILARFGTEFFSVQTN